MDAANLTVGVVCRRTGLTPDLLRAWERRYGVVEPRRSPGGHRLFTEEQVQRLALLKQATEAGHRIQTIAGLDDESVVELLAATEPRGSTAPLAEVDETAVDTFLESLVDRLLEMDGEGIGSILDRAGVELGRRLLSESLLPAFLNRIGEEWEAGRIRPAHEHVASAALRSFLGRWLQAFRPRPGAPKIVVATPSGERHEFGALLAASVAAAEGWSVVYLGADLPVEDIAASAREQSAHLVGISVTDRLDSGNAVEALRAGLPDDVTLIVGGAGSTLPEGARGEGVEIVADFERFRERLAHHRRDAVGTAVAAPGVSRRPNTR